MAVWPKPLAWRKTRRRGWYHYRPKITIPAGPLDAIVRIQPAHPGPDGEQDRPPVVEPLFPFELAWRRWYDRIPVEVRNAIAPFRSRHWQLLSLVARCGNAALDLLIANPALAYALASNWIFHKPAVQRPLRSARALLAKGKRQRDILEWLSFPATEAFRKLLMKVSPKAVSVPALFYLRQNANTPGTMKALSHLPRINASVIRVGTDPDLLPYATPNLLAELAMDSMEDERPQSAYILRDTIDMMRTLNPDRDPVPVASRRALHELHETLIVELNLQQPPSPDLPAPPFPAPPLEGTIDIVPLTDAQQLAEEGFLQRNCVASYVCRVASLKRAYVYKVLAPERCTLAVTRRRDRWVLAELKRAGNTAASPATRAAIQRWIASNSACS
jgi:hypothetical protein